MSHSAQEDFWAECSKLCSMFSLVQDCSQRWHEQEGLNGGNQILKAFNGLIAEALAKRNYATSLYQGHLGTWTVQLNHSSLFFIVPAFDYITVCYFQVYLIKYLSWWLKWSNTWALEFEPWNPSYSWKK